MNNAVTLIAMLMASVPATGALAADEARVVQDPYDHRPLEEITPDQRARSRGYSPYAGRGFPTKALFGDTHHHTANSGDAFMGGNRLMPEQAYRFARGEEVMSCTGVPAKLSRPLDFLVVSDHAEGLGVITEVYNGNPDFTSDPTLARWNKMMQAGGKEAAGAQGVSGAAAAPACSGSG